MSFWKVVTADGRKEPPLYGQMKKLNDLRNLLKHGGTMPRSQSVRDLLHTVEAFCVETTKLYLDGLDFVGLGLEQLIASGDVQNALRNARKAFDEGQIKEAFTELGIAFDKLFRDISTNAPLIDEPPSIQISERQLPKEQRDKIAKLVKTVGQSARTLNVLMLGIDPVRYRFFLSNTPRITRTLSDKYQAIFQGNIGQTGVFDTCFDFVVESALTMAEVFRADEQLRKSMP